MGTMTTNHGLVRGLKRRLWQTLGVLTTALLSLVGFGAAVYLFTMSHAARQFSEEQLIRDMIWLDAYAVLFFLLTVGICLSPLRRHTKAWLMVCHFSIYGFVTISLLLSGTPFSMNGYWGDQAFRQAMILKFQTFPTPGDFYYKDLPPFYPPLYYLLLSFYSRIFGVEAYKMLKVGSLLIYMFGPSLLFIMWRKIVSPLQAMFITLATYLVVSGRLYPLLVPHAFLADSFFVPWWLYFIERVRRVRGDWRFFVVGGLVGGALFCTYFYAFFIGAIILVLRETVLTRWKPFLKTAAFNLRHAVIVLSIAAVASSPYWLPLFASIVSNGIDRSRGGWHHAGVTGLDFDFLTLSPVGLLYLSGICYAFRYIRSSVFKALSVLLGASIVFWMIGSILGSFDVSVNLVKTRQFVLLLSGPFIGLALAGLLRLAWVFRRKMRWPVAALLSALLLGALSAFNANVQGQGVKKARTCNVPDWAVDASEMKARAGTVFLAGDVIFHSFYPVYAFNSVNEHYAHPASHYKQRYDMLYMLKDLGDPCLINLFLQHNVFDAVDYVMPTVQGGVFNFYANLSNYPNKSLLKTLSYPNPTLSDERFFRKLSGRNLYEVVSADETARRNRFAWNGEQLEDSLGFLLRLAVAREFLDDTGRLLVDEYMGADWSDWSRIAVRDADFKHVVEIVSLTSVNRGDSVTLFLALQPRRKIGDNYRIFLHVYGSADQDRFDNYDFSPPLRTDKWEPWDIVFCQRTIARPPAGARIHLGFFKGKERLGAGAWFVPGA